MFCTYCAIPYARGGLRSRSIESVRAEAEKLNNEGFSEVVLTGIHLMSYGRIYAAVRIYAMPCAALTD